ncbi:MAG: sulfotransferase [Rickettsiales bacterium]|nr:sulfotransferase [Rickettsiales bacterium]
MKDTSFTSHCSFLAIGAGRGGTSILGSVLDAHPKVGMGMEAFAKEYLMGLSIKQNDFKHMVEERTQLFLEACDAEATEQCSNNDILLWGNKITTEQIYGLETYNSIHADKRNVVEYFFDQVIKRDKRKVIFILRDGRNCAASKVRHTAQALELAVYKWKYSVGIYLYLKEHFGADECYLIKLEDLVREPVTHLQEICQFLSIDYDPQMLHGTEGKRMPKEYRRPTGVFDKKVLLTSKLPKEYTKIMEPELIKCGYNTNNWLGVTPKQVVG